MKIRLKSRAAGPDYRGGPGDELDLPPKVAVELIEGGYADPLEAIPETATSKTVTKKAVKPTAKK